MKTLLRSMLALLLAPALMGPVPDAMAATTDTYTFSAKSYSGSRDRQYKVYVPDNLSGPAPMVMTLHGCVQDHHDVDDWGMREAADRYGFILVTPFITSYDGMRSENCWGFWFDQHTHEGQGEPEDLHQIGLEVESNYSIDPNRRYITGLSSGGAMTMVAAVTHNEYWAAAAPAAGLAYGETSSSVSLAGCYGSPTMESINTTVNDMERELNDSYAIPLMVLANNRDCVVQQPAGRNMRDAHLQVFGGSKADEVACEYYYQSNYGCRHAYYTVDGYPGSRSVVETIFFDGPLETPDTSDSDYGHYWVAGADGSEAAYNRRSGPSYPDLVWDFFSRHARDGSGGAPANGKPQITLSGDNPMELALYSSFSDPGASATDPEDGALSVNAACDVDTSTVGEYYCTYTAEDSSGNVASKTRTVIVSDPNAPAESCASVTASPKAHLDASRASKGGNYDLYAITTGDAKSIGYYFDTWSEVTLHEGAAGEWFTAKPAACGGGSGGGGSGGGGGGFVCQDWYTTNNNHDWNGRAYYSGGYYTQGGDDSLGGLAGSYTYVKETAQGFFEAGQCN
ncbi:PHB depolymerase family esterase [Alkalilimnicola sp. S0819]|uniref:extracellular catalytic domain type 1 short-chain-length polyhydroxyalkanoate depolymerase n=1 Tax=Alkalilimnicola sp. S0819 TaxID=2613922 RepID=UPI001262018F|nr:PHB depolymerase family esterase [Alkalilimnicola sp. S0819]KAB7623692.1 PHB depolymerase family esterase [Alkalilimnicola sp. S0819]MPQ16820.1 PHB depolymerase family esterase [Alkalilimnicola sp. S0819]